MTAASPALGMCTSPASLALALRWRPGLPAVYRRLEKKEIPWTHTENESRVSGVRPVLAIKKYLQIEDP